MLETQAEELASEMTHQPPMNSYETRCCVRFQDRLLHGEDLGGGFA